jgi:hypothetical protein
VEHAPETSADGRAARDARATIPADAGAVLSELPLRSRDLLSVGLLTRSPGNDEHRAAVVRTLQRRVGNAATSRWLARETLKEKVEKARSSDPKGYVMKAVAGMAGKFSFEERVAEITWRMIWMFIPEKINGTLVSPKATVKGIELEQDPPPRNGDTTILVGSSFIDGINDDNVMTRVDALRLLFAGKDGLIAKAKTDFGFAAVTDGTSNWTAGSLAQALAGLEKLPNADRGALAGVTLLRNATGTAAMPSTGGTWVETGQFNFAVTTGPDAMTQTLQMFDDAFRTPDEAAWTAVHEAGHAADSKRFRDTLLASNQAQTAFNATTAPSNAAGAAEVTALNAALRLTARYPAPARSSSAAFVASVRAVHNRLNALTNANTTAQLDAATTAVNSAISTRDTALGALPAGNPAGRDFARTITLQTAWLPLALALATAAAKLSEAKSEHTAASGASNGRISRRLERFLKVVRDNHIDPITPYARAQWNATPSVPEDFWAEAYSMWLNDPKQLAAKAPALKAFFDHGEHLK